MTASYVVSWYSIIISYDQFNNGNNNIIIRTTNKGRHDIGCFRDENYEQESMWENLKWGKTGIIKYINMGKVSVIGLEVQGRKAIINITIAVRDRLSDTK